MSRYRFAVIGSGWRAQYYVRVAKALPDLFELCAIYCRSEEKAAEVRSGFGIPATTSEDECAARKPDFVVVAVNKTAGQKLPCAGWKEGLQFYVKLLQIRIWKR